MAKKPAAEKKPDPKAHPIKVGELFIKETYFRLHRQKHGMTTESATAQLETELKTGAVVIHGNRAEITIYKKIQS